ncbi:MAG: amidohydrolase family protein, partial [Anaerolineae bacterium]|nr:amidohydrolase family protein [Anaerolineae bacterium]
MSQTKILIHNAHIYAPGRDWNPGWLVIDGSRISLMGSGKLPTFAAGTFTETINAGGKILLPGFIDLHTHGAMGHEAMDASEEGLREMARFFAKHGVTAFLPTTWTAQGNVLQKVVETLVKMIGPLPDGATILGTHLEG